MSEPFSVESIEAELKEARTALTPRLSEYKSGVVQSMRFYHSSKTRHNALIFKLENGESVYKDLRDNAADVLRLLSTAKNVVVWYDDARLVQQFVANYTF